MLAMDQDRLSTLRKSLEDMSFEELREHVRQIRADRRLTKERPAERKKVKAAKEKSRTSAAKLARSLSASDVEALLREFGDGTEGDQDQFNQGGEQSQKGDG